MRTNKTVFSLGLLVLLATPMASYSRGEAFNNYLKTRWSTRNTLWNVAFCAAPKLLSVVSDRLAPSEDAESLEDEDAKPNKLHQGLGLVGDAANYFLSFGKTNLHDALQVTANVAQAAGANSLFFDDQTNAPTRCPLGQTGLNTASNSALLAAAHYFLTVGKDMYNGTTTESIDYNAVVKPGAGIAVLQKAGLAGRLSNLVKDHTNGLVTINNSVTAAAGEIDTATEVTA